MWFPLSIPLLVYSALSTAATIVMILLSCRKAHHKGLQASIHFTNTLPANISIIKLLFIANSVYCLCPHCRGPQSSCPLTLHQRGGCSERESVLWSSCPTTFCHSDYVRVYMRSLDFPLQDLYSHSTSVHQSIIIIHCRVFLWNVLTLMDITASLHLPKAR